MIKFVNPNILYAKVTHKLFFTTKFMCENILL